jgi:hypothetical protein
MAVFSFVFFAILNRIEMERMRGTDEAQSGLSPDQLVTLADLRSVRDELLAAINRTRVSSSDTVKKWLKSSEVRKLLNISPGKLLALRASRQLAFVRLGGVIYYDRDDIEAMVQKAKMPTLVGNI